MRRGLMFRHGIPLSPSQQLGNILLRKGTTAGVILVQYQFQIIPIFTAGTWPEQ